MRSRGYRIFVVDLERFENVRDGDIHMQLDAIGPETALQLHLAGRHGRKLISDRSGRWLALGIHSRAESENENRR